MKSFLLASLAVLTFGAFSPAFADEAQSERQYTILQSEMDRLANLLYELPAKYANPILAELQKDIMASERRAAEKTADEVAKKKSQPKS